jgi:hypothetical protein
VEKTREVSPPKPVLILIEGHWFPGRLDKWVREHDGWYGNCRELREPGEFCGTGLRSSREFSCRCDMQHACDLRCLVASPVKCMIVPLDSPTLLALGRVEGRGELAGSARLELVSEVRSPT